MCFVIQGTSDCDPKYIRLWSKVHQIWVPKSRGQRDNWEETKYCIPMKEWRDNDKFCFKNVSLLYCHERVEMTETKESDCYHWYHVEDTFRFIPRWDGSIFSPTSYFSLLTVEGLTDTPPHLATRWLLSEADRISARICESLTANLLSLHNIHNDHTFFLPLFISAVPLFTQVEYPV